MFANVSPIFSPIMFINDHQCCSNVLSLCRQVSNMAEIGAGTKNRPIIPRPSMFCSHSNFPRPEKLFAFAGTLATRPKYAQSSFTDPSGLGFG